MDLEIRLVAMNADVAVLGLRADVPHLGHFCVFFTSIKPGSGVVAQNQPPSSHKGSQQDLLDASSGSEMANDSDNNRSALNNKTTHPRNKLHRMNTPVSRPKKQRL